MKLLRFLSLLSLVAITTASFAAQNLPYREYVAQPGYIKTDMEQIAKLLYAKVFLGQNIDDQKIKKEFIELSGNNKVSILNMFYALGHPATQQRVSVKIKKPELKNLNALLKDTEDELRAAALAQQKAEEEEKEAKRQASLAIQALAQQAVPAQSAEPAPAQPQPEKPAEQPAESGWLGSVYDWWYGPQAK